MKKSIEIITILILIGILISCKSNYRYRAYEFDRGIEWKIIDGIKKPFPKTYVKKSIVFISDSTLNYNIQYGGIGASTTIKYKIDNNSLIIDTVDIYNRKSFQGFTNEIFGVKIQYSNDSLIDKKHLQKYYLKK